MIVGATVGELAGDKRDVSGYQAGYVLSLCLLLLLLWRGRICSLPVNILNIFRGISLITIACAFAISKAMVNSGVADSVAKFIIGLSDDYGPHVLLAMLFIITNLFTELITNNAAAALAFPLALSICSAVGSESDAFLCCDLYGCFSQLLYTYRLSD